MNLYESFAELCEHILLEASTTFDILKDPSGEWHPGADMIMDYLMRQKTIKHDVQWTSISAAQVNAQAKTLNTKGAVVLLCERGTAWLNVYSMEYESFQAYVGTADEMRKLSQLNQYGSVRTTFELPQLLKSIKETLGPIQKAFVTQDTGQGAVSGLRKKRAKVAPKEYSYKKVLLRFKPLWSKVITQAMADVKGFYMQLIKNDAYGKAEKKMEQVRRLRNILDELEAGDENALQKSLLPFLVTAVHMAAAHHYPNLGGKWEKVWNGTESSPSMRRLKPATAATQLLSDLGQGDNSKLGTVLAYLKQELLKGA
jgi:hypothetical protein